MELILGLVLLGVYSPMLLIIGLVGALISVSLFLVFVVNTYLYSYLVFMLFMSGVVILLMYMCGIILIEKSLIVNGAFPLASVGLVSMVLVGTFNGLWGINNILVCFNIPQSSLYFEFFSVMKFIYFSFNLFSLFFIVYLFICLIIIYEIVKKCTGPLRMKN
uniref:NADH dehydrogenase subunit 6 n=1 Tax=Bemisia afer TaxID=166114 RepID=A0A023IZ77_BEMAF|nr:NADH dehydrogenase subunit 6 [Bemisia afer]AHC02245.1 NADH dehydrogenase subunit 6 [Bemisia afer]